MRPFRAAMLASLLTAIVAGQATAYPLPGRTTRLSVSASGAEFEEDSAAPAVSADGSVVAFWTNAPLVAQDTNGFADVYVRDLSSGAIERVSVSSSGAQATTETLTAKTPPAISGDGRLVAFESGSAELVANDTNGVDDVFVHDRETRVTTRVSVSATGAQAAWHSAQAGLSQDGRYVFFMSEDDTLVAGDASPYMDIFRRDLQTGALELVTRDTEGRQSVFDPSSYAIDADGSVVAWAAKSPTYEIPDPNGPLDDIFVRDLATGVTERISKGTLGLPTDHASVNPALSGDGRYVAFGALANNLVPADSNGWVDVFVYDRVTGRTQRVSVDGAGRQASQGGGSPVFSADGRSVAFNGISSDLSSDPDVNGGTDVYVHDLLTGATELVSRNVSGAASGDGISYFPHLSADAGVAVFASEASDLVAGDENWHTDIFARTLGPRHGVGEIARSTQGGSTSVSGWARFEGPVSQGTDSASDATVQVHALGGEIVAGRLAYRPEHQDLYVRVDLDAIPHVPSTGRTGAQGINYTMDFAVKNVTYQVRLAPQASASAPVSVRRCAPACVEIGQVPGGLGTAGSSFTAAVPLSLLNLAPDSRLTGVTATTSYSGGVSTSGDTMALPQVQLADPRVEIGVAPPGTEEANVVFATMASLSDGRFSANLGDIGNAEVWARACVGAVCSPATKA